MYKLCTIERNENPRGLLTVKYLLIIRNDDAQIFHSTYISLLSAWACTYVYLQSKARRECSNSGSGEIIELFLRNLHCVCAIIIEHFVPLHQVRLDCCDNNSSAASFAAARKTSFRFSYVNRVDWAAASSSSLLFSFAMSRSSRHERCRKLWLYEKEMSRDREKSWGLYTQHEMSKWWARKLLLPSCSARTRPESSVPKTIGGGEENI